MFSKDTQWFVSNFDQISAFEKWIEVAKSDLPKQISMWLQKLVHVAIRELESQDGLGTGYSIFQRGKESEGHEVCWSLPGLWNQEKGIGAFISIWVPYNIDWLTFESSGPPALGLYYFDSSRLKTTQTGEKIVASIKALPRELGSKRGVYESHYYVCADRPLDQDLSPSSLGDPKNLGLRLCKLFKEFTVAVRPGLEAAMRNRRS
jgi:hypothetical protein